MKILIKKAAAIILVVPVVLTLNNCKKEKTVIIGDDVPTADFTLGKSDYKGGETLVLTSSSSNAKSVRWTLPDGTTSKSNSVSWATDTMGHEQTFQFKLEAISEHGTKSDYIVKNVKIKPTTGNVTLYSYTNQTGLPPSVTGTLSVDGKVYGEITIPRVENTNNAPTGCNQSGHFTLPLPIGYRSFNFEFVYSPGGDKGIAYGTTYVSVDGCKVVGIPTYYWN